MSAIRIGVDTGGTFTDVVLLAADGALHVHKLLSTPDDPAEAVLRGIAQALADAALPGPETHTGDALQLVHGSTVATNALLEGRGGRAAFVTTAGFEDLLWLRRQHRPDLYDLEPVVPLPPLRREDCRGLAERVGPDGTVLAALADAEVARFADWLATAQPGLTAVAICLLHSYANPRHEQRIASVIRTAFPELHVTVSSDLLPQFREYERASTCLVNAVCAAPMLGYLGRLEAGLDAWSAKPQLRGRLPLSEAQHGAGAARSGLRIMGSAGGSLPLAAVREVPARTVLSGPAGGAIGALHAALEAGVARFLGFDIGGTSTDVTLSADAPALAQAAEIAGLPVNLPLLDIHTVGAGGGSIAWLDAGGVLRVGPQSLGSSPGPACYGRQAAPYVPAVTDAHAVLGHFPPQTRLAGSLALDIEAARDALDTIARPLGLSTEAAAEGVLRVAAAEVARALRRMSVERGHDPRDFTLLPFGGAGGLHAVEMAEQLGIAAILLPRHPGLLSALGMLFAGPVYHFGRSVLAPAGSGTDTAELLRGPFEDLLRQARAALDLDGVPGAERSCVWSADLRYRGQSHEINVPFSATGENFVPDPATLTGCLTAFAAEHLRLYGYNPAGAGVELVTLRLEARGPAPDIPVQRLAPRSAPLSAAGLPAVRVWRDGEWQAWRLAQRSDLCAGDSLPGPLLLSEFSSTALIPAGWEARVLADGAIVIGRAAPVPADRAPGASSGCAAAPVSGDAPPPAADPVRLAIFRHLYSAIAEEMGARLMRSAYSPNIKERRDFSCALLDGTGQMLAQAAHIPVHLGSMPLSVDAVIAAFPQHMQEPGDVFVVNDPFHGGTHLPDITVVAPVFLRGEALPRFFVANRAHHADIGGISPGSMPLSRSIDEEGLRILPQRLDRACIDRICAASRTPGERRGDLQAQLAALELGRSRLLELCAARGAAICSAYGAALLDYSERCLRQALALVCAAAGDGKQCGPCSFTDYLDDDGLGSRNIALRCRLTLAAGTATVDLRDCDPQVAGPLNAVHAICVSAALYCFRCLAQHLLPGADIPENAGLLRAVNVLTRPGTVAAALPPAAVAGGNVETSQRLTDLIFGALAQLCPAAVPAASAGSMSNLTIGNAAFAYYETLAGGAGGGPRRSGASALHTHMTNTLNTPIEALEHAYPLQITRYALRSGSGGAGRHSGGDGIVRRYRALEPCTATLLTERRVHAPWGLAGGSPGQPGANLLFPAGGGTADLGGKRSVELAAGDELELATPGGGGWGAAD